MELFVNVFHGELHEISFISKLLKWVSAKSKFFNLKFSLFYTWSKINYLQKLIFEFWRKPKIK